MVDIPLTHPKSDSPSPATNEADATTRQRFSPAHLFLAASAALFLGYAFLFFNYLEDDAFIPMRYALNFWRGHGFVMNPGEHVEGCTSPLHLWYLTLLLRFLSPEQSIFISKFIGIGLGIAVLVLTQRLGHLTFARSRWIGNIAPLLVAAYPAFAMSMINGLETEFAAFFLLAAVVQFTRDIETADCRYRRSAILFLFAAFSRPELTLTFPVLALIQYLKCRDRRLVQAFTLYLAPLSVMLVARLSFYGDLLPNTYYAKAMPLARTLWLGVNYWTQFALLGDSWFGLALTVIGLFAVIRFSGQRSWPFLMALCLHCLFLLKSGGDWMMDGRFFTVIAPFCAILWVAALWAIWEARLSLFKDMKLASAGVFGFSVACMLILIGQDAFVRAKRVHAQAYIHDIRSVLAPHAPFERWMAGNPEGRLRESHWIASHARPGETVLFSEMGLVPLLNMDLRFIDVCGLTDHAIARMHYVHSRGGVHEQWDWQKLDTERGQYIAKRRPEWIVLIWNIDGHTMSGADLRVGNYAPSGTFPFSYESGTYTIATWHRE